MMTKKNQNRQKLYPAVFLDRDGVIVKLIGEYSPEPGNPDNYITKWEQVEFIPGAIEGLKLLAQTDYKLIVVSNQSGIGRGYCSYKSTVDIFDRMVWELSPPISHFKSGETVDTISMTCFHAATVKGRGEIIKPTTAIRKRALWYYFCPHHPDAGCCCRKPRPGMIYHAAIEHNIDLSKSWMVGDSDSDMDAGELAEIANLIQIGESSLRWRRGVRQYRAHNLLEAAKIIIGEAENG